MTCIGRKSGDERAAPILATRTCVCGLPGLSTDNDACRASSWARQAPAAPACRAARRRTTSPQELAARPSRCHPPRPARRCSARSSVSRTPPCRRALSPSRRPRCQPRCSRTGASSRRGRPPSPALRPAQGCRAAEPVPQGGWHAAARSPLRETTDSASHPPRMSSVAGKFFVSDRAEIVVASIELLVLSDAPSLETSSAICSALRFAVPSSSIAATKFAMPGLSRGFASLPVRSTRFAATIGRPRRSLRMSVRPFESVADRRRRQLQRTRRAGTREPDCATARRR